MKTINEIIFCKSQANQIFQKLCINGENIHEPKLISNVFNDFFVNIDSFQAHSNLLSMDCSFTVTSLIFCSSKSLFLRPVAEVEIVNHILSIKSTKSAGKYGI